MASIAISTITYPYPPPTTNTLDSQQRARLMRSTRKLGAVLGTTPYLLEGDIPVTLLPIGRTKKPTSKALKRQGSIFMHHHAQSLSVTSFSSASTASLHAPSPSASLVSLPQSIAPGMQSTESLPVTPPGLSSIRSRKSADKPRPLYLRLNTVPVSPTDNRFASLPPTPSSRASVSYFPPTPRTPSFSGKPDLAEIRRKRMAKLARHLGENVPAELVFASEATPKSSTLSRDQLTRKRRSMSVGYTNSKDVPFAHGSKPSVSQSKQDWVGEWNRSDIREVQKELRNLKSR
ncbi:hypothetical protein HYDPIDRAFT_117060 [Hydnomerulius pinastri MD-312]|uniref:Unplaced genomic scaffold scaffold_70, whole genome shotgun sequence n=1 Tax=Hydnomerulius pinastri MD-312 TaxID=994086 RepID=A0A0C9VRS9_9AGAM|nr:hypothetical protein HYDPIDRAFT_118984 [Hydnomerulius pinastri MD-312]KIJ60535.1 hypothetical protein HYDPIDRAFT_117060 [Hydnomerulius pinastri MD-312]